MLTERGARELQGVARRLADYDSELRHRLGAHRRASLEESLRVVTTEPWGITRFGHG